MTPTFGRKSLAMALALFSADAGTSFAQSAAAAAASNAPGATPTEETVKMSAFEVTTTQGHGYVATNADAGFKTNQALLDIPQDIQVVTRDMIDDIGSSDSSTLLQYFGQGGVSFLGESTAMRGYTSKYPYVDDMPENQPYEDNFFVDSYVVVRGPAQALYVLVNPTGVNLKYTKKPLPYEQTILQASVTSWGGTRIVLDNTGPIGTFGEAKIGYRFAAVQQGPNSYFYNVHESHQGLYPVIDANINNITTLRMSIIWIKVLHVPGGTALISPTGKLLDPAGPREVYLPPNSMEQHQEHRWNWVVDNKVSENWDFRFAASYWHYYRYNPILETNTYNWAAQTVNWFMRLNDITLDYWTMIGDGSGKWHLGSLSQQENFGFAYEDTLTHQYLPGPLPSYGWGNTSPASITGTYNAPLTSIAAVNAIRPFPVYAYPALGSPGAPPALHNQGYNTDIYMQHTMDIIPKYLSGVFGWTWANVASDNSPNVAVLPYQATVVAAAKWIHRFGLVFKPIPQVSVYAMTGTGFAPPSGATPTLYDGSQAPPQSYEGNEVGFKTNIMNGKISTTLAVFKIAETNLLAVGPGVSAITGSGYYIPIGAGVGEGEDADIELYLTNNWQLIAYGYLGHWLDQNHLALPSSYDNSWSLFTRYAFAPDSPLRGLVVGGGMKQVGGAHVSTANINGYTFAPVPFGSTQTIKVQQGFDSQVFTQYPIWKHMTARLAAYNLTNDHYVTGFQGPTLADEAPPFTVQFELDLKF